MRRLFICVAALAAFFNATSQAAYAQSSDRPKIGLVLGGGGARGSAHVGVLKVLEENRIPVHVITGTSMGSLIGGGYASGLSPQEIEKTIGEINWKEVMDDYPVRSDLAIRDKLDRRRFLPLEFGIKDGKTLLPEGAIQGQKIEYILHSMIMHVAEVDDFNKLPIPFQAVATDLETGEEVDITGGNLADAMRASMAVPGAFSPVELNGRLLADGYIVKNVPVDLAQQMGADVLIVVDVGSPLPKRDELNSFMKVMGQAGAIMTRKNVQEQLAKMGPNDILIQPDLGDITTASFDRCLDGIATGEVAANKVLERLSRYSVSESEYVEFLKSQRRAGPVSIPIDFVDVEHPARVSKEAILAKIHTKAGQPLDLQILKDDLTRIHALGDFEKVGYRITDRDGKRGLIFEAHEKSWGPNYLRVGLNLGTNFRADSFYNIMADYKMTELNSLGGQWKSEGQFGRTDRIYTEFYQPLEHSRTLFIAPSAELRQDTRDIYSNGQRVAEYRARRLYGGVEAGLSIGTQAEVRAGTFWGTLKAEPSTGNAGLPEFDVDRAGVRIQATYDQLDDVFFPKNGFYAKSTAWLEVEDLGAEESYEKYDTNFLGGKTFGRHTFLVGGNYNINPDDDAPFYDQNTLGGFLSLSGFHFQELRGNQSASLKGIYYYQVMDKLTSFVQGVYVGGTVEGGQVWNNFDDMDVEDFAVGGSVFVGVRTLFGPLYLAYGQNEDAGDGQVTLYLGQIF
jgi:NTE family protein